jgi:hypothetical protein
MGLWDQIKNDLNPQFSLLRLMEVLGMDETDKREARNILHQLFISGKIRRISKNMYQKLE